MATVQLVWLLGVAAFGFLIALALVRHRAEQADTHRRWARVADRRAPLRSRSGEDGTLLDHVERQIERLLTERHRVELLLSRGERVRRQLQRTASQRDRAEQVEAACDRLRERRHAIEDLVARYRDRRDEAAALVDAVDFERQVADYETQGIAGDHRITDVAELDEAMERLVDIADATEELDELLRA